MSRPVFNVRAETFSSIAAISGRASHAATSEASSSRRPHHVGDQRRRQRGELGQISAR